MIRGKIDDYIPTSAEQGVDCAYLIALIMPMLRYKGTT